MAMLLLQAVLLSALLQNAWTINSRFPPNFKFGAGSSAYQVEGGWNADGKGLNIWDRYVQEYPSPIKNNDTGNVATDSYRLWREDVKAAAQMKLQFYRFSLSWTRILPSGFTNEINKAGVKYYSDLIDALLAEGIEPVVTIYHWDLPLKISDLGGWTNPLIVKWFGDYARIVYSLYANRVKTWLTINEPIVMCDLSYNAGATGIHEEMFGPYLCNKYALLAHAEAYRIFDKEFRPKYTGRISLANHALWMEPASPNDTALAELVRQHQLGRYSYPIFSKEGGWPPSIEKVMLEVSLAEGHKESRLPAFTEEEIEFVKGTADFYGINHYTSYLVRPSTPEDEPGVWPLTGSPELEAIFMYPPDSSYGASPVFPVYPVGIRRTLAWLKQQYGDIDILITENGFSTSGYQLADYGRVNYIWEYLEQVQLSIKKDNVSVIGYTAWSLTDNFEWADGYTTKFGLYEIDFSHTNRTRTPRVSANYYACVIAGRSLDVQDSCWSQNYALFQNVWTNSRFPPNFKFGAGSSAYQIEGGWNADGKGLNIWDRFVQEYPSPIMNNDTGNVATDSYRLWREDVKAAAQMKLQFYRFSLSWARILPSGFTNEINKAGVKYYSDLIDTLLAEGIEPVVTIYHWELPVKISDLGGWTNPLIVNWFGDYARVVYSLYADRVKTWLTLNEPVLICDIFYNTGTSASRIKEEVFGPYLCNKYVLLAHAKAYRIFDAEYRPKYKGRISLANHALWIEPATPNDTALAELGRQHQLGRYSYPIFSKKGGWPPSIEKLMLKVSLADGYSESRLPSFTKDEIEFIKGTADFYGMNHYTTYLIRPSTPEDDLGIWPSTGSPELQATLIYPPGSSYGASPIFPVYPKGIRRMMAWVKRQYGDVDILITENGFSTSGYQLADYRRVNFMREYLDQVLLSIEVDNVNVIGYAAWSLTDNFEWLDGYITKFGLYEIDYDHPNRTRIPRISAHYYACVTTKRSLDIADSCFNKSYAVHRIRRTQNNGSSVAASGGMFLSFSALFLSFSLGK
ncbi:lactase/phlorizin hydrolase-like [Maniola hyperantus]|uniref:lactase/phlorizin hydrolase-like n=1 Tax=Aphantopus hyperantus TaxID=2795564 RepID=UPI003747E230